MWLFLGLGGLGFGLYMLWGICQDIYGLIRKRKGGTHAAA
jgi:hypothetical protein